MKSKAIQHPERLIDVALLREKLNGLVPASNPEASKVRPAAVELLKEFLKAARVEAEKRLLEDGKGTQCAKNLAYAQDEIIRTLYEFAKEKIYPKAIASALQEVAIIATGGYGRGTLAPGSDIDLLFLLPGLLLSKLHAQSTSAASSIATLARLQTCISEHLGQPRHHRRLQPRRRYDSAGQRGVHQTRRGGCAQSGVLLCRRESAPGFTLAGGNRVGEAVDHGTI